MEWSEYFIFATFSVVKMLDKLWLASWRGIEEAHGLSQDLETGCPKLAIISIFGILFFKGEHNLLRL